VRVPWPRRSPPVVRELDLERIAPFRTGALIATFRCAGRMGAGAKRRSVFLGQCDSADCRRAAAASVAPFAAGVRELITRPSHWRNHRHLPLRSARTLRRVRRCAAPRYRDAGDECTDERARSWSRRKRRAYRFAKLSGNNLRTGALIVTLRCAAPARRGAFADERRMVGRWPKPWTLLD
jgi:hypothetical protein